MGIREVVDDLGGFATRRELRAAGATDRMLTAAVRTGILRRVRNGWYSTAHPESPRFQAVRVGGLLTGLSAFEAWDAWVWRRPDVVHVAVAENAARLRRLPGVRIHWQTPSENDAKVMAPLPDALVRVFLDEDTEVAVPCADWALASGRLDRVEFERCLLRLPLTLRRVGELIDSRSQSVLESVARIRLRRAGFRVASQQRTGILGASDLVIENTVALELDGHEFHAEFFERDRRRDLVTTAEGRHVIRVSARMLRDDWPGILAAIRAALKARRVERSGDLPAPLRGVQRAHLRRDRVS